LSAPDRPESSFSTRPRLPTLFAQPAVVTWESTLCESEDPLYPEELAFISGCVEKRQREFAASRRGARKALAALGIAGFPLLPGRDRAPIWPPRVVGTITHTDGCPNGYCGVAVADNGLTSGLGIDAEPRLPLPSELWPRVLDDQEQREALATTEPGIHARLVFSAKETTYKTLYPIIRQFLEFSDVHIQTQFEQGIFFANLVGPAANFYPVQNQLIGRLVIDSELIVTTMMLPPESLSLAQGGLLRHHVPC
jgi:4'-phosphopantetheinyl transferase EntD